MSFLPSATFTDKISSNSVEDISHRRLNYDLCVAIDVTKLSIALDKLVEKGMPKAQADAFMAQARGLRALVLTENNRLFGF